MKCKGFNFVRDRGDLLAVVSNSDAAAVQLGYAGVEETRVATIIVNYDGKEAWRDDVGEGKYRSAIFLEAWKAYRGQDQNLAYAIPVDDVFLSALEAFVGETIWAEATETGGDKHAFIRAILAGVGQEVTVDLIPGRPVRLAAASAAPRAVGGLVY